MRALSEIFRRRPPTATLSPLPEPAPVTATVALAARSGAEQAWKAGLIQVEVEVRADQPVALAALVVRHDGRAVFEKPLADLGPEPLRFWLALHGQLLPDGACEVGLEVVAGSGAASAVLASQTLTLQVRNRGRLAARVAESLRSTGAPLVLDGVCDSRTYDYGDPSLTAWFDRPEPEALAHVAARLAAGEITAPEAERLRQFVCEGYLTLPDVVGAEHLARLNAALDAAVADRHEGYEWGSSQRMHGLHQQRPAIRELWEHPQILRMLELIWGSPALPCQSLSYVFGSEQQYHQDTVHLTPFPAGYMCGVWTALEDVAEGSGELVVFPGSHRFPRVYAADVGAAKVRDGDFKDLGARIAPVWKGMLNEAGSERRIYQPKAGTVLIWHENLMHAGSRRRDPGRTRRSIVCHYFAEGAVAYYDSLGEPGFTSIPEQAIPEQAVLEQAPAARPA